MLASWSNNLQQCLLSIEANDYSRAVFNDNCLCIAAAHRGIAFQIVLGAPCAVQDDLELVSAGSHIGIGLAVNTGNGIPSQQIVHIGRIPIGAQQSIAARNDVEVIGLNSTTDTGLGGCVVGVSFVGHIRSTAAIIGCGVGITVVGVGDGRVAQCGTFGSTTGLTGLGGIAVSCVPAVTQSLTLGHAAELTGLGSGTGSGSPVVRAGSLYLNIGIEQCVGDVLVIGVEELHGVLVEGHGQRASRIVCHHALKLHQHDVAVAAVLGGTNDEDLGLLGELRLGSIHGSLQAIGSLAGAFHIGQTFGEHQLQLQTIKVLYSTHGHGVGDGITGLCLILVCSDLDAGGNDCHCRNHSSDQAKHNHKTQDNGNNTLAHNQAPFIFAKP